MSRRRLIVSQDVDTDVLVVGGGLAGAMAAIRARDFVDKVTLVEKSRVGASGCSTFAAGIYNVCLPPDDDPDLWAREVIECGVYMSDQVWTKLQAERGGGVAELLDRWGDEFGVRVFEKNADGSFVRRQSRGHVHTRHLVVNSLPMMKVLRRQMHRRKVALVERTMITDLVPDADGRIVGAVGFDYRSGEFYLFRAKTIVLAAGGCGFKAAFIGHKNLTGDLQAAAYRRGGVFTNMEQGGSNTCFRHCDIHGMNLFVNVGGKFVNGVGEEFMWAYNPKLGNRALLPELCLAFCREVKEGRGPIYLDATSAGPEDQDLCRKILPETFRVFGRVGVDPFLQRLEWVPVWYGTITTSGGLRIDIRCRTNLPGVYAVGDAAAQPVFGLGLGGVPLAFASVSGYLGGETAAREACGLGDVPLGQSVLERAEDLAQESVAPLTRQRGVTADTLILALQQILFPLEVCYIKEAGRLSAALNQFDALKGQASEMRASDLHDLVKANEVRNMITLGELFLRASLFREESRGYHCREEFPATDNEAWLKWVMLAQEGQAPKLWTEDVPTPLARPEAKRAIPYGVRRDKWQ